MDYFVKNKRKSNLVQKCHVYMLIKNFNRKSCDKDAFLFICKSFFYNKVYVKFKGF